MNNKVVTFRASYKVFGNFTLFFIKIQSNLFTLEAFDD